MGEQTVQARATNDLTQGPIVKKIIWFALPVIASNLLMQLYNAVDSIVIGQYAGAEQLAAVGSSNAVMMLFNSLFMGFSMGASIVVSQTFGAKNMGRLRQSINTIFALAFTVGLFITFAGVVACRPLLEVMNVPGSIIDYAQTYLTIIFVGTLGNVFFNYGGGILRGMGDSRWPLIALVVSCVLNIVLDVWSVYGLGMGVAGVAWATVIGQTISGLVLAWRINRSGYGIKISFREMLRPDRGIIAHVLRLGLPSGMQQTVMSLTGVVIQSFTNQFGPLFIAANSVVMRLDGFVLMPLFGLGMTTTTFVGQNIGAGNLERARKGVNRIAVMIVSLSLLMGCAMYFFGYYTVRAFTSDAMVMEIAMQGVRIICFIYTFMGLDGVFSGAMRGAGVAVVPMVIAITTNIFRIPLVYQMAIVPYNYLGVFYSMAITMTAGSLINAAYYRFGNWHEKGVRVAGPGAGAG